MILPWLILIPIVTGVLAWFSERAGASGPRWVSLGGMCLELALLLRLWGQNPTEWSVPWIPPLGITLHLALDGLSMVMLLLTAFIGIVAVACSWSEIRERIGFFHFNLMLVLAGIAGVFLAMDLFLFYFFWELMLIPMYFLIAIWGYENRIYAAVKFFIFTQLSGLLMLLAILRLYFAHGTATGDYTFDYVRLIGTALPPSTAMWVMLGFLAAFCVKLPAVPVHNWLPDAHTEAPTAGSVILAALLLKTGAYGLMRFVPPLFPEAAHSFAPVAMVLGVVGILYGAVLAFAQTDLKRMVAYTSVSHMGFVLLGVFAWNTLALQGALMQMVCHGLATGALFVLVGLLKERTHTRDLRDMGGLWSAAPRMGAFAMFFAVASLGMPGLGNFIAEFLILLGAFGQYPTATAFAALGLVLASVYSLWLMYRAFFGPNTRNWAFPDLVKREAAVLGAMALGLVWLGMYPRPILETSRPAFDQLRSMAAMTTVDATSSSRWEPKKAASSAATVGNYVALDRPQRTASLRRRTVGGALGLETRDEDVASTIHPAELP